MGSADPDALVIRGIPLSEASVTPASYERAPAAIRHRLSGLSTYDGVHGVELSSLPVRDDGDGLGMLDLTPSLTVVLGGHNAVTFHALSSVSDLSSWGLLTFDAHHDVRPYQRGIIGNGSPVRALIDSGLPGHNVVQVGINGFSNSRQHRVWCEEQGVTILGPKELDDISACLSRLEERCSYLYVDVDMDVLDRAFAPGCPGARPGGVVPGVLFEAVHNVAQSPKVRVIDIVEVDPDMDPTFTTVDSAALVLLYAATGYYRRPALGRESSTEQPNSNQ